METTKEHTLISPEKEKLDIVEKKIDIQKKRTELQKEKLAIQNCVELKKFELENQKIQLDKIAELRKLISENTIDVDRSIVGGEPFLIPLLNSYEREIIMNKLINIVKRM